MYSLTEKQITNTLKIIESTIHNCKKIQPRFKEGSPSMSLSRNRIQALSISRAIILHEPNQYSKEELEKAIFQISSIKNKCHKGLIHSQNGSSTYTRFSRLIEAMDIILLHLNKELEKINEP